MPADTHTLLERAVTSLELYEAQETDLARRETARKKIDLYRAQLSDPAIKEEVDPTGRRLGLVQDLELIVQHSSSKAESSIDALRVLIKELHNSIQGP